MTDPVWKPLQEMLAGYRIAGRRPKFWLRDDDAIEPTPALDRLLELTGRFAVPVALAVIPALITETLPDRLVLAENATVVVHGWSHQNHAGPGEKKQELGGHRPVQRILDELAQALAAITARFPSQAQPVLVPPWNRIDSALLPHLTGVGFTALSAFGEPKPSPLPTVNATVDIIDWHGTRGCREHAVLIAEIARQLSRNLDNDDFYPPIGILTHHRVHDDAAWSFLKKLLALTAAQGSSEWRSIGDLAIGDLVATTR